MQDLTRSEISFLIFLLVFVVVILFLTRSARRRQHVSDETERVAAEELPKIGEIAERAHSRRFGRPPTDVPKANGARTSAASWYPESKKYAKRHA